MENIGLQLYSIKELTQNDFFGTLEMVGKIGYDGVEFAGYFGSKAKELKDVLDSCGLRPAGSHIGIDGLINNPNQIIEYSLEIGDPYIIIPALPGDMIDSKDSWKKTAEIINELGDKCNKAGLKLGYHNHDFELKKHDESYGLDILVENTQPENCFIELDTYWVEFSNLNPVDFIEKYNGRCKTLHIKDMKSKQERVNTEIGKGVMDFKAITKVGIKLGVEWFTIEQESYEIPQLQSIEESFKYLRSIL